jgi:nonsense-mediated mRNA decay protein 3
VLTRFVVLNKELAVDDAKVGQRINSRKKMRRADLTVMREADMGISDEQFIASSHIGYLCRAGDVVLGYHLEDTNIVDDEAQQLMTQGGKGAPPQIVIVRKLYGGAAKGADAGEAEKKRVWKLQRLEVEKSENIHKMKKKEQDQMEDDEEDFLRELEADKDMRGNVNLYKDPKMAGVAMVDEDEEVNEDDDQEIKLDELLDGLDLDSGVDPENPTNIPQPGVDYEYDESKMWGGAPIGQDIIEEGAKAKEDGVGYFGRGEEVADKTQATQVTQFGSEFIAKGFKF